MLLLLRFCCSRSKWDKSQRGWPFDAACLLNLARGPAVLHTMHAAERLSDSDTVMLLYVGETLIPEHTIVSMHADLLNPTASL